MKTRIKGSLALLLVLSFMLLAACGSSNANNGNSTDEGSKDGGSADQVELNMWSWHPSPEVWKPVLDAFYKKYPGIKVNVSIYPSLDYQQKTPIALNTEENIDIIGVQATGFAKQVEPYLANMDELMKQYVGDDWESRYDSGSIEQSKKITDKPVTAPIGSAGSMVIYYNMGLLQELGLNAPSSYEDLKKIAAAVREKKPELLPMAVGGKEGWVLDEIVMSLVGQHSDLFNQIRYEKGASFDTPEYAQGIKDLHTYFQDGIISEDVMDLDYSRSLEVFAKGQAVMFVQGTWESHLLSQPVRESKQINLQDVGMMAFPSVNGTGNPSIRSFIDIGLGVTEYSKHKKEAMDFVRFVTLEEGADMLGDQFIVVPSKTGYSPKEEQLTTPLARESYERMVSLVRNPSADRNNLSSLSDFIGTELQKLVLTDQKAEETVKNIQKEFATGKYN